MSGAWLDRVGDLTLFEALTGGAFDCQIGNIAGNLTKIFQKSQMPRGLPGGGDVRTIRLKLIWLLRRPGKTYNCIRKCKNGYREFDHRGT